MVGLIRVVVVDDHPVARHGLADALAGEPDLSVVGQAADLETALRVIAATPPDVVVADIQLGQRTDGFLLLERLSERARPAVLLFSSYDYPAFYARAMELGAAGYLLKTTDEATIRTAVRAVARGDSWYSTAALRDARSCRRLPSMRETEVIAALASGGSNDEIGRRLDIGTKTVESHLRRMFARYAVANRTELAMLATHEGWIVGR